MKHTHNQYNCSDLYKTASDSPEFIDSKIAFSVLPDSVLATQEPQNLRKLFKIPWVF